MDKCVSWKVSHTLDARLTLLHAVSGPCVASGDPVACMVVSSLPLAAFDRTTSCRHAPTEVRLHYATSKGTLGLAAERRKLVYAMGGRPAGLGIRKCRIETSLLTQA